MLHGLSTLHGKNAGRPEDMKINIDRMTIWTTKTNVSFVDQGLVHILYTRFLILQKFVSYAFQSIAEEKDRKSK